MAYQAFARKYRPRTFEEIVGQEPIVRTLTNSIRMGRIAQSYLFVGPRGTGKTSTARVLAKALNCTGGPRVDFDPEEEICREIAEGRSLDVLEIDGASNNGVEQVRELRENVRFAPAKGRFKIYVIDEVHMLTQAAFNALLKTLEEPPEHVRFIFATTEGHKIPSTVLSRCQRFDFRKIPVPVLVHHLQKISQEEGIVLHPRAALAIAAMADGSLRDAEVALDQLTSFFGNEVTEEAVLELFGLASAEALASLGQALIQGETERALEIGRSLLQAGKEPLQLAQSLLGFFRNLAVSIMAPNLGLGEELHPAEREVIARLSGAIPRDRALGYLEELSGWMERIRFALRREILFEVCLIELSRLGERVSLESLLEDLARLPAVSQEAAEEKPLASSVGSLPEEPRGKETKEAPWEVFGSSLSRSPGKEEATPQTLSTAQAKADSSETAPRELGQEASAREEDRKVPAPTSPLGKMPGAEAFWETLLSELAKVYPKDASHLQGRTRGLSVRSEVFEVEVLPKDRKEKGKERFKEPSPEARKFLEQRLQEAYGTPKRIEFVLHPEAVSQTRAGEPRRAAETISCFTLSEEEFRNDPAIERALEVFQARILSIEKFSPPSKKAEGGEGAILGEPKPETPTKEGT
jgi:DNA polymerase-3 subunit gamma/tau